LKLLTWNIQWGLGMDGRCDLARVIAEARRIDD
jgi:endonuclease/exonuclease/phosphatase family metal-dependent hydrolase